MNQHQERWWVQAQSDYHALVLLRKHGAAPCHQLHYVQMVTEKLAKAYLWRTGRPPPRSHAGFVQLIRFLGGVPRRQRNQIAQAFRFARFEDFERWIRIALPLVYAIEKLVPDLAHNGPNPEYPWPHAAPAYVPATFDFDVWRELAGTAHGRRLVQVIQDAVEGFPIYA